MVDRNSRTAKKIQQVALEEYQEQGFEGASLRQIVKKAGVTTGAFYGYYKNKEELFDSFVEECALKLRELIHSSFSIYFKGVTSASGESFYDTCMMPRVVEYILEHRTECDLLLQKSKGTRYEHYLDDIIRIHQERIRRYIVKLNQEGIRTNPVSPVLNDLVVKKMYETFFNLVVSDIPENQIRDGAMYLINFYINGWEGLLIADDDRGI